MLGRIASLLLISSCLANVFPGRTMFSRVPRRRPGFETRCWMSPKETRLEKYQDKAPCCLGGIAAFLREYHQRIQDEETCLDNQRTCTPSLLARETHRETDGVFTYDLSPRREYSRLKDFLIQVKVERNQPFNITIAVSVNRQDSRVRATRVVMGSGGCAVLRLTSKVGLLYERDMYSSHALETRIILGSCTYWTEELCHPQPPIVVALLMKAHLECRRNTLYSMAHC